MAEPTYVAAGAVSSGAGALTPGAPAGWQQNDIFILQVSVGGADTVSTPSGWTAVPGSPRVPRPGFTDAPTMYMFWRRVGTSFSAPTIADPGSGGVARIHAFRGCPTSGDPWDVITDSGVYTPYDTTISAPSVTTTEADTLVVVCFAGANFSGTSPTASGWANSNLTSITERADNAFDAGTVAWNSVVVTGIKATAGSVGATTGTASVAVERSYIVFALKGDGPPPVTGTASVTLPKVTSSFTAHRHTQGGLTSTLPSLSASFAAQHYQTVEAAAALTLPKVTGSWAGNSANAGSVSVTLPSIVLPGGFQASSAAAGGFSCTLPSLGFGLVSETRPFGRQVIVVEPEKRAFRITDDDMIPMYWWEARIPPISGTFSPTLPSLKVLITADVVHGSFGMALPKITSSLAAQSVEASISASLPPVFALSEARIISGTVNTLLPSASVFMAATGPADGALAVSLPAVSAGVEAEAFGGPMAATLPSAVAQFVGQYNTVTSTLASTLGAVTSAFAANHGTEDLVKHAASVGDGTNTSYTVTHNLGTRDVIVRVYENASPWQEVKPKNSHATTNTVTVVFASAPSTNAYRVVVLSST